MNDRITQAREALEQGLASLETSDQWKNLLRTMAVLGPLSLGRFSFGNILSVMVQCPQASFVATFEAWKRSGRCVRKGEKALWILQPCPVKDRAPRPENDNDGAASQARVRVYFRPLAVFDVSQTDGEPLPTGLPTVESDEAFPGAVEALRAVACARGIASGIELRDEDGDAHGWFDRSSREIVVRTRGRARGQILKTLAHELAHALLHSEGDHHSRPEREVEAESVAFVVCHALGLDTSGYSLPYVSSWAGNTDKAAALVQASGERIHKASRILLDALAPAESGTEPATAVA